MSNLTACMLMFFLNCFEAAPIVKFSNGLEKSVKAEKWVVRTGTGGQVTRIQVPLQLAWAISIHKSQVWYILNISITKCACVPNDTVFICVVRLFYYTCSARA